MFIEISAIKTISMHSFMFLPSFNHSSVKIRTRAASKFVYCDSLDNCARTQEI